MTINDVISNNANSHQFTIFTVLPVRLGLYFVIIFKNYTLFFKLFVVSILP